MSSSSFNFSIVSFIRQLCCFPASTFQLSFSAADELNLRVHSRAEYSTLTIMRLDEVRLDEVIAWKWMKWKWMK